jgi:hypothetical protein
MDRNLLSKMVHVSNNSKLTNIVCNTLNEKLTVQEINDFKEWLRLVETEILNAGKLGLC